MTSSSGNFEICRQAATSGDLNVLAQQVQKLKGYPMDLRHRLSADFLDEACKAGQDKAVRLLMPLVDKGALDSSLVRSSKRGDVSVIQALLTDSRTDPDYNAGWPLQEAIVGRHHAAIDLLFEITSVRAHHLQLAVATRDEAIQRKIMEKVDARSDHSVALREACKNQDMAALALLLAHSNVASAAAALAYHAKRAERNLDPGDVRVMAAWRDLDFLTTQVPREQAVGWVNKYGTHRFPLFEAHGREQRARALSGPALCVSRKRRLS